VAFVLVAAAIYFFVVLPMNMVMERRRSGEAPPDHHDEEMPGVPQRDPDRCPALCPLRAAGSGCACRRLTTISGYFFSRTRQAANPAFQLRWKREPQLHCVDIRKRVRASHWRLSSENSSHVRNFPSELRATRPIGSQLSLARIRL